MIHSQSKVEIIRKTHFCLHSLLSSVHLNWHLHRRCEWTNLRGLSAESQSICSFSIRAANSALLHENDKFVCCFAELFVAYAMWKLSHLKIALPPFALWLTCHNSMRFLQVHITDITSAMNMKSTAWKNTKIILFLSDTESRSYTNRTKMRLRPISEAWSSCARWTFLCVLLCSLDRWWVKIRIRFACLHWTVSRTTENPQIIFWRTYAYVRVEIW